MLEHILGSALPATGDNGGSDSTDASVLGGAIDSIDRLIRQSAGSSEAQVRALQALHRLDAKLQKCKHQGGTGPQDGLGFNDGVAGSQRWSGSSSAQLSSSAAPPSSSSGGASSGGPRLGGKASSRAGLSAGEEDFVALLVQKVELLQVTIHAASAHIHV